MAFPMGSRKRVLTSLVIFLVVFALGVAGFKVLGGPEWTLLDSVYMTAITIGTIGYGETHDLSANPGARAFTTVYIFLCLGTIAYAVSSITAFVVEGELKNILGRRRMEKDIQRLSNHYIVCGSDETAHTIVQEMLLTKKAFVVVEPDRSRLDRLAALGAFPYVQGDAAEDSVLEKAGLDRARGLIACLPTDEANLFVTIGARSLHPQIRIVAKAIDPSSNKKMLKAGADSVISPTFIGGMRMVSEMIRPAVTTFLDMMLREKDRVLRFDEHTVPPGSPLAGRTIGEARLGERTGALLVALRKGGAKDFLFNPNPSIVLAEDDVLVFIATPEMIQEMDALSMKANKT
jgi:voltage-gated potassium channel